MNNSISDVDRAALSANEIKRAQYEARWLAAQPKEARDAHLAGVLEKRGQAAHDALREAAKQAYAEAVRNVVDRRLSPIAHHVEAKELSR